MMTLLAAYAAAASLTTTTTTTTTTTSSSSSCIMTVDDRIVQTFGSMPGLSVSFLGRLFDMNGSQAYVLVWSQTSGLKILSLWCSMIYKLQSWELTYVFNHA